jgi:hypothetical protein
MHHNIKLYMLVMIALEEIRLEVGNIIFIRLLIQLRKLIILLIYWYLHYLQWDIHMKWISQMYKFGELMKNVCIEV